MLPHRRATGAGGLRRAGQARRRRHELGLGRHGRAAAASRPARTSSSCARATAPATSAPRRRSRRACAYGRALPGRGGITVRYLRAQAPPSPVVAGETARVAVESAGERFTLDAAPRRRAGGPQARPRQPLARRALRRAAAASRGCTCSRCARARAAASRRRSSCSPRRRRDVLVVLPVTTWQGLNPVDDDGDGRADTLLGRAPVRSPDRSSRTGCPRSCAAHEALLLAWLDREAPPLRPHDRRRAGARRGPDARRPPRRDPRRRRALAGRRVARALRRFVRGGGRCCRSAPDSLRRSVTLTPRGARSTPTLPTSRDLFGARLAPVVRRRRRSRSSTSSTRSTCSRAPRPVRRRRRLRADARRARRRARDRRRRGDAGRRPPGDRRGAPRQGPRHPPRHCPSCPRACARTTSSPSCWTAHGRCCAADDRRGDNARRAAQTVGSSSRRCSPRPCCSPLAARARGRDARRARADAGPARREHLVDAAVRAAARRAAGARRRRGCGPSCSRSARSRSSAPAGAARARRRCALPFRVPIASGGSTANLLVPLYLVIAAGVLAYADPALRATRGLERTEDDERRAPRRAGVAARGRGRALRRAGGVFGRLRPRAGRRLLLRAVRAALRAARAAPWTPRLAGRCLGVLVVLAIVFVGIGFVEYATRSCS